MTTVSDNLNIRLRTYNDGKMHEIPIEFTLVTDGEKVAMKVKERGFKQSAVVNPASIKRYGTYEMALRYIEWFFANIMLMGPCEVFI